MFVRTYEYISPSDTDKQALQHSCSEYKEKPESMPTTEDRVLRTKCPTDAEQGFESAENLGHGKLNCDGSFGIRDTNPLCTRHIRQPKLHEAIHYSSAVQLYPCTCGQTQFQQKNYEISGF